MYEEKEEWYMLFLIKRFILVLGIKPNKEINRKLWKEAISFAAITA